MTLSFNFHVYRESLVQFYFFLLNCLLSYKFFLMSLSQPIGLGKIAKLINMGKIDSSELITMKTLKVCIS